MSSTEPARPAWGSLRVVMVSMHTSPATLPGTGDAGGMNVYVRELVSALSQAGVECTTYTRRTSADQPEASTNYEFGTSWGRAGWSVMTTAAVPTSRR